MSISITAAEKQILQSVNIPPRPEALLKISEEAKKPEPDLSLISEAISSDISISAAVLQIVNSAAFRRAREIESIHQAVMTLGLKRLIPLVKSVALKSAMGDNEQLANFWDQASKVAMASSFAADALKLPALKDHAYMLGLFHNAGVPIMMLAFDDYGDVLTTADSEGWHSILGTEAERFGTTHTTVSALLGQKWKLPAIMTEVIYYQHEVEGLYSSGELSDTGLHLLSILKLARASVYCAEEGTLTCPEWLLVQDDILERFDLQEEEMDTIREQVQEGLH